MTLKLVKSIIDYVDDAENGLEAAPSMWLSTGIYALNKIISGDFQRGLPFGKVVEIFGDPATGKSLLISHLIAEVQKIGGVAILDDTENAYNPFFGEKVGINNEELIRVRSTTIEDHIEKLFTGWKDSKGKDKLGIVPLIRESDKECPILICLDSLGRLSTRHEMETGFEKSDMTKAKNIKKGYRLAGKHLQEDKVLYILSNHVYYKIGVMFGNPKATPGGTGTPFESSVRLDLTTGRKQTEEEESGDITGIGVNVQVVKNRLAPPFKKAKLIINWETGVDKYSGLLEVLEDSGIIKSETKDDAKRDSGFYSFNGERFRRSAFPEFFAKHKEEMLATPVTPPVEKLVEK